MIDLMYSTTLSLSNHSFINQTVFLEKYSLYLKLSFASIPYRQVIKTRDDATGDFEKCGFIRYFHLTRLIISELICIVLCNNFVIYVFLLKYTLLDGYFLLHSHLYSPNSCVLPTDIRN